MGDINHFHVVRAIQDFRSARQKAVLREIMARFTGESLELLSFDEVRQKLRAQVGTKKVLKEIAIDSIIGSVNRYQDFTRDFLPGRNIDEKRWANVEAANQSLEGLPPIEAYQIGEVYFVSDGNHRVSVARQQGTKEIQAYVTEVHTRVPLTADIQPEELILKYEYAQFLENTNIDRLRPEADLSVTVPAQYGILEEHIAVHRYYMGIEQQHEIQHSEAVMDWHDQVYLPVVHIIRDRGLLLDFPNRTETDLYLWIAEHRAALEEECKTEIEVSLAAQDLADHYSHKLNRVIYRVGQRITSALVPNKLRSASPGGAGPSGPFPSNRQEYLFCESLVPINGHQDGWFALQQALIIARREHASIHGLYVQGDDEHINTAATHEIQNEFSRQCEAAGLSGVLLVSSGDVIQNICEAARWNDLVVINLTYPPEAARLARLSSGIRNLIRRCPRPLLFTPQVTKPLHHALLADDGSLEAREAVYLAAYLVNQWEIPLHVISIGDPGSLPRIHSETRHYMENHAIQAEYLSTGKDENVQAILDSLANYDIDLLLMGGYSRNPFIEFVHGAELDEFFRQIHIPVLISR